MRFTIIDLITLPVLQYRYITLRLSRSSEMSYSHTTLEFIEVSASVKIDLTDELGRRTVSLGASRFFEINLEAREIKPDGPTTTFCPTSKRDAI